MPKRKNKAMELPEGQEKTQLLFDASWPDLLTHFWTRTLYHPFQRQKPLPVCCVYFLVGLHQILLKLWVPETELFWPTPF